MGKRSGIQLAVPYQERLLLKRYRDGEKLRILTQPKLDGERCRAVWNGSQYILLSSEENQFIATPHVNTVLNALPDNWRGAELDGELYVHGKSREYIHSVVSRTNELHPEYLGIQYHVFDFIGHGGEYDGTFQLNRMIDKKRLFESVTEPWMNEVLRDVPTEGVSSIEAMWKMYDLYVETGYEGIIIRHPAMPYKRGRDWRMLKFKPSKSDTYLVIGYKEEISINGEPKGRLGALVCEDRYGNQFSVGSGLDSAKREAYWANRQNLPGKWVKINYQRLSVHGIPLEIVFDELLDSGSWD